jgi:acetylornithine deacetylase/succinyl-diaminopimelate desuccinylase-like protein
MLFLLAALLQPAAYDAEIAALQAHPRVETAIEHLHTHQERSIEDLVLITEIPAPPFGEAPRAALVKRLFEKTGFGAVAIDEAGNVVMRREGTEGERTVAVLAHIDTVFPEGTDVTVRREGDAYVAPGIGDNSRGVVLLLELARAVEAAGIETEADVLLVGNVGEEGLGDLSGVRHLFREGGPRIDAMIAIDGGEDDRVVTDAVGSNRYRVTYRGPGGHSWSDFGAPNPHHALGRAISVFQDAAEPITREGPKASYSVGIVRGGTSVNSIPFESAMQVDMRSSAREKLAALDAAFQEAMALALAAENDARRSGEPLTLEIEPIGRRPAGEGDQDAPLVQRALAAVRARGLEPVTAASSTDANIPLSLGIPAVTLARGGISEGAHSAEERWRDVDSQDATEAALLTLLAEAGLAE